MWNSRDFLFGFWYKLSQSKRKLECLQIPLGVLDKLFQSRKFRRLEYAFLFVDSISI